MLEIFQQSFMIQALVASLLLAVILSYFGVHVVMRGIVFIDLALAQISSAGVAFAILFGWDPRLSSVLFTLLGAFGMSLIPTDNRRVPQEAIIGSFYAIASAVSMLLIAKTPHGDSDVTTTLFGNILAVSNQQISEMVVVFGLVGTLHMLFRKQLAGLHLAEKHHGSLLNPWNILFYLSLALIISEAVSAAGVLQVFSYLIIPACSALLVFKREIAVFAGALAISVLASISGLYTSYTYDLPTGAAIVACFGFIFILVMLTSCLKPRNASL